MNRFQVKVLQMQKAFIDAVSAAFGMASASGTSEEEWNALAVCIVRISECISDLKHVDHCADSGIRIDALFMILWDYIDSFASVLNGDAFAGTDHVWFNACLELLSESVGEMEEFIHDARSGT